MSIWSYDYALQTTPIVTSIYAVLAVSIGVVFVLFIPWSDFSGKPEYFNEISLPDNGSEVQLDTLQTDSWSSKKGEVLKEISYKGFGSTCSLRVLPYNSEQKL